MNIEAINALPSATKSGGIPARLDIEGQGPLTFLFNPEAKSYSREASYAAAVTGGGALPDQNYTGSSGRTLALSNLLLDSYAAGKSLRPYLNSLESLLLPKSVGLAPPTVFFNWGSESFGPAVVKDVQWEETAWLSGEPAMARVSLNLIQIPPAETPSTLPAESPTGVITLTERQRSDARAEASKFLEANASKLRPDVRAAYNSKRFKYLTNEQGLVRITDLEGKPFGAVGTWDGFNFVSSKDLLQ